MEDALAKAQAPVELGPLITTQRDFDESSIQSTGYEQRSVKQTQGVNTFTSDLQEAMLAENLRGVFARE